MAAARPSQEELLVRRVLSDKLEAARAELREVTSSVADSLRRAEVAERAADEIAAGVSALRDDLAAAVSARKSDAAVFETVIESLRSEVAAMATDKERAEQAEAALADQAIRKDAEIAELRAQLKDLQVKVFGFRKAVEGLL